MPPGIAPPLLLSQVENTAPFLFAEEGGPPYARVLRAWKAAAPDPEPALLPYFELCMAAHWATAGAYVPTNVDSAIRLKLWNEACPEGTLEAMADVVLDSASWDYVPFTARRAALPDGSVLATHEGTWFSVAAGAYAAMRSRDPERAGRLSDAVAAEVRREARGLAALLEAGDGLGFLKAAALVCHNLGDLDRVVDMWELPEDDPLRRRVYAAGLPGSAEHHPLFARAAEVNSARLAPENHRHLALRAARCLRRRREFLLPVGPFFDDWGAFLGDRPRSGLSGPELGEVVCALLDGMSRGVSGEGYPRALAGILDTVPGGFGDLSKCMPSSAARALMSGALRQAISLPRARFEARWAKLARGVL
ncbi:MAG: hypothetical protein HYZ75_03240 [Elusimicrobia bacterium]|nr:hypothetical protein [Elusimicrobiota bacterium]